MREGPATARASPTASATLPPSTLSSVWMRRKPSSMPAHAHCGLAIARRGRRLGTQDEDEEDGGREEEGPGDAGELDAPEGRTQGRQRRQHHPRRLRPPPAPAPPPQRRLYPSQLHRSIAMRYPYGSKGEHGGEHGAIVGQGDALDPPQLNEGASFSTKGVPFKAHLRGDKVVGQGDNDNGALAALGAPQKGRLKLQGRTKEPEG